MNDLEKCSSMVDKDHKQILASKLHSNMSLPLLPIINRLVCDSKWLAYKQDFEHVIDLEILKAPPIPMGMA